MATTQAAERIGTEESSASSSSSSSSSSVPVHVTVPSGMVSDGTSLASSPRATNPCQDNVTPTMTAPEVSDDTASASSSRATTPCQDNVAPTLGTSEAFDDTTSASSSRATTPSQETTSPTVAATPTEDATKISDDTASASSSRGTTKCQHNASPLKDATPTMTAPEVSDDIASASSSRATTVSQKNASPTVAATPTVVAAKVSDDTASYSKATTLSQENASPTVAAKATEDDTKFSDDTAFSSIRTTTCRDNASPIHDATPTVVATKVSDGSSKGTTACEDNASPTLDATPTEDSTKVFDGTASSSKGTITCQGNASPAVAATKVSDGSDSASSSKGMTICQDNASPKVDATKVWDGAAPASSPRVTTTHQDNASPTVDGTKLSDDTASSSRVSTTYQDSVTPIVVATNIQNNKRTNRGLQQNKRATTLTMVTTRAAKRIKVESSPSSSSSAPLPMRVTSASLPRASITDPDNTLPTMKTTNLRNQAMATRLRNRNKKATTVTTPTPPLTFRVVSDDADFVTMPMIAIFGPENKTATVETTTQRKKESTTQRQHRNKQVTRITTKASTPLTLRVLSDDADFITLPMIAIFASENKTPKVETTTQRKKETTTQQKKETTTKPQHRNKQAAKTRTKASPYLTLRVVSDDADFVTLPMKAIFDRENRQHTRAKQKRKTQPSMPIDSSESEDDDEESVTDDEEEASDDYESDESSTDGYQPAAMRNFSTKSLGDRQKLWDEKFKLLVKYKKKHGTTKCVPSDTLYNWVCDQRKFYYNKKLLKCRFKKLDSIGFDWTRYPRWKEMYNRLVAYKRKHNGSTNVPPSYEDRQLGIWVITQRRANVQGWIKPDRRRLLDSIGFVWQHMDPNHWMKMYKRLVAYKKKHGHTRVPGNCEEDPLLGNWVRNQRGFCKNQDRVDLLNEIGFTWSFGEARWKEMYERLVAYKKKYGNALVKKGWEGDPQLAEWVVTQRKSCKVQERIDLLNEIGFVWGLDDLWLEMYERLVSYKEEFGHTLIRKRWKRDPKLAEWVRRQRSHCREKKRIDLLNEIGFNWTQERPKTLFNDRWFKMYKRLVAYKNRFGHTCVPKGYKKDVALAGWVRYQRSKTREKNRVDLLNEIGFAWRPGPGYGPAQLRVQNQSENTFKDEKPCVVTSLCEPNIGNNLQCSEEL